MKNRGKGEHGQWNNVEAIFCPLFLTSSFLFPLAPLCIHAVSTFTDDEQSYFAHDTDCWHKADIKFGRRAEGDNSLKKNSSFI